MHITMISLHDNNYCHSSANCRAASSELNHEAGGPLNRVPQAYWANSCPRSPMMNVGSTTKHANKNSRTTTTKTTSKIATSTSTIMTIAIIVATTNRAKTRASPASSNGEGCANKSSNWRVYPQLSSCYFIKKENRQCASQVFRK